MDFLSLPLAAELGLYNELKSAIQPERMSPDSNVAEVTETVVKVENEVKRIAKTISFNEKLVDQSTQTSSLRLWSIGFDVNVKNRLKLSTGVEVRKLSESIIFPLVLDNS